MDRMYEVFKDAFEASINNNNPDLAQSLCEILEVFEDCLNCPKDWQKLKTRFSFEYAKVDDRNKFFWLNNNSTLFEERKIDMKLEQVIKDYGWHDYYEVITGRFFLLSKTIDCGDIIKVPVSDGKILLGYCNIEKEKLNEIIS